MTSNVNDQQRQVGTEGGTMVGAASQRRFGAGYTRVLLQLVAVLASITAIVVVWQLVIWVFNVRASTLPSPKAVLTSLLQSFDFLRPALITTIQETLAGFLIAAGVGVLLASAIAASRLVERLVYPILIVTNAVPKIALAPVFLAWFGLDSTPRVVMAALLAIFPIVISTVVGFAGIDDGLLMLGRSTNANRLRVFRLIKLPAALPGIFGGLKVGVTLALTGAVVAQLVGGNSGLGYTITTAQGNLQLPLAFAAIVLLAIAGVLLFYVLELLELLVTRR